MGVWLGVLDSRDGRDKHNDPECGWTIWFRERQKGGDRLRLREVKHLIQSHTARRGPVGFNPKAPTHISYHWSCPLERTSKGWALATQQLHLLCPDHLSHLPIYPQKA